MKKYIYFVVVGLFFFLIWTGIHLGKFIYQDANTEIRNCFAINVSKKPKFISGYEFIWIVKELFYGKEPTNCSHYADVKIGNEEMTFEQFLSNLEIKLK